jgi:hypothetical protein
MKRAALGIWRLLVLGSAVCSDRGLVVADTNDTTSSAWGDAAGAESSSAGDGDQDQPGDTDGTDTATGGKSSGTGGRQEARRPRKRVRRKIAGHLAPPENRPLAHILLVSPQPTRMTVFVPAGSR